MGATLLVSLDLDVGSRVLTALEQHGISVDVLMWAVLEEYGDWRLLLYSESFQDDDREDAYGRTNAVTKTLFAHPPSPIMILRASDPFLQQLRSRYGQNPDTYGLRLRGSYGDRYIEDAFVYRIR